MKMFCLVHAGGFAMRYDAMADLLAKKSNDGITMIPLEYAGRGQKYGEPFYTTFDELTHRMGEEIAGMLGPSEPYCLFGHCMGGYAAMETAYYMQEVYHNPPVMTVISGASSPVFVVTRETGMTDEETISYLREIGGTEETVLKNRIFETELLPILQADLDIIKTYRFTHENKKLQSYVAATYGEKDFVCQVGRIEEWCMIADKDIVIQRFAGDHFYFEKDMEAYTDFLCEQYRKALTAYTEREGGYPLTDIQKSYLLGRNAAFSSGGVSTHVYFEFKNNVDMKRYEAALNKAIRRHPMLYTVVYPGGYQCELDPIPTYAMPKYDMREASEEEQQAFLLQRRQELSHKIFAVGQWPMFAVEAIRLSENETYLFYSFDLMIADGSSLRLLLRECMEYYRNPDAEEAALPMSFRDYVLKSEMKKSKQKYTGDRVYWEERLEHIAPPPELPYAVSTSSEKPRFERLTWNMSEDCWKKLQAQFGARTITASNFFLAAYAAVLGHYAPSKDFCLNVTLTNRTSFAGKLLRTMGDFTSLLLLEIAAGKPNEGFWDKAQEIQTQFLCDYQHRAFDGVLVEQEISRSRGEQVLYPVVFTSMIGMRYTEEQDRYLGTVEYSVSQTPQVYLDFQLMETEDGLMLTWDYLVQKFDRNQITEMFTMFRTLVETLAEGDEPVSYLRPENETLVRQVETYNATQKALPVKPMHELFAQAAKRFPNRLAVTDESGSLTYAELDQLSNALAAKLQHDGVQKGTLVAVEGWRRKETVVQLMAVLKAGAAYVPIDPSYPQERKDDILQQGQIIHYLQSWELVEGKGVPTPVALDGSEIAYIIFTSGSTGIPKGVVITHHEASNTLLSINERFGVTENDKVLGISSMCFDLSVYDMFGTLAAGGELVMVSNLHDIPRMAQLVREHGITLWNSVPAIMQLLMDITGGENIASLNKIMLSGDWISPTLARDIREKLPDAALYSLGGATEGAIWSIYYPVDEVGQHGRIPYGYPLDNQRCYVLDANDRLCPWNVIGEIVIGGDGVAEGYLNQPEITARQFKQHPTLGRVYHTGDLGRFCPEGWIEILGRMDGQVKVNGFRIEKGEIESVLGRLPFVKRAVVEPVELRGRKQLAAFVVGEHPLEEDEWKQLRQEAMNHLTAYMIPAFYVPVDEIPLTSNGKVDRKQLQTIFLAHNVQTKTQPKTEMQKTVFAVFRKNLGYDDFGMDDSFLQMGMDSVSVLKITSDLNKTFGIDMSFERVMNCTDIKTLADMIEDIGGERNGDLLGADAEAV